MSYDVIVIGLGGMGSAAAYRLAQRGKKVLGLEKFTPVHTQGSSHGGSRITRQAYFEDPAYVPLLLRAHEMWDQIERDSGEHIFHRVGGIMVGRPDSKTVQGSLTSAQRWDLKHEVLDAQQIRAAFPDDAARGRRDRALRSGSRSCRAGEVGEGASRTGPACRCRAAFRRGRHALGRRQGHHGQGHLRGRPHRGVSRRVGAAAPGGPRHPVRDRTAGPVLLDGDRELPATTRSTSGNATKARSSTASREMDGAVKTAFFRGGQICTPETIDRTVHDHEVQAMADFISAEDARHRRCLPACRHLHVHEHQRRALRHRPPPRARRT